MWQILPRNPKVQLSVHALNYGIFLVNLAQKLF